jgi:hypothetical protein
MVLTTQYIFTSLLTLSVIFDYIKLSKPRLLYKVFSTKTVRTIDNISTTLKYTIIFIVIFFLCLGTITITSNN